jgi:hypothetical protein
MEKESGLEVAKFLAQCISCCTKEQICLQGGGMKNRHHDEDCHKSSASELKAIRSIRLKNGSSQGTQRTMATFTILSSLKKATQSSIPLQSKRWRRNPLGYRLTLFSARYPSSGPDDIKSAGQP